MDAKERRLKVHLALEVNRVLEQRGLTQVQAAKLLGLRQPHVSDLVRYRLNRFSVERLMEFLTLLGKDVEQSGSRKGPLGGRHRRCACITWA